MSGQAHSTYAARRSAKRKERRDRIHLQVLHPIDTPSLIRDPLAHARSTLRGTYAGIKLVVLAGVVHALILGVLYVANEWLGQHKVTPKRDIVTVAVVEVPKKKEPEPEPPQEPAAPVVPDFAKKTPEPKKAEPKRRPAKPRIEKPAQTPKTETKPAVPRRFRAGVSMESTVTGGPGPAMETGDSRMGRTATKSKGPATGPASSKGRTDKASGSSDGEGTRQQRRVSNIPGQGATLVKPKRVRPSQPPYPKTLEAQGIEGEVKVRVNLDTSGRVVDVAILKGSGHKAFDDAAKRAARRERFRPAYRDGKAVPFTISYTYRFDIKEK